jgi:hypothetical protein
MTEFTILLLATEWNETLENSLSSLRKHDFKYEILASGQQWKGWKWRTQVYMNALRHRKCDEVIVFLDAYDTLCRKHSSTFLKDFSSFSSDIVIGCEWYCGNKKNCGRVTAWWEHRNYSNLPSRQYVNAGCIIGKVSALTTMYTWISQQSFDDDQLALAAWVDAHPHKCSLDYGSSMVYNSHILDMHKTPQTPYFLHYPGPLFKYRLFPRYNNDVKKVLGIRGRLVYSKESVYALFFCLIVVCSTIMLYKLV